MTAKLTAAPLPGRQQGGALTIGLAALAAILLAGFAYWFFACPCERTPGAWLSGEVQEAPVPDWSFANQVPLCQIQTNAGVLPHAINLNCMASEQGNLYLSCSQCEGKRWSSAALEEPAARLRLDGDVYPVRLRRLTDPAELDTAWQARHSKLQALSDGGEELQAAPPRPDHWWSFQVTSRQQS